MDSSKAVCASLPRYNFAVASFACIQTHPSVYLLPLAAVFFDLPRAILYELMEHTYRSTVSRSLYPRFSFYTIKFITMFEASY